MDNIEKECLIELIKYAKGNLTLDDFSERTGVSKFQLSRILNGKFKEMPRKSTLAVIAEHSVDEFAREVFQSYLAESIYEPDGDKLVKVPNDNLNAVAIWVKDKELQKSLKKVIRNCKGVILMDLSGLSFDWTVKHIEYDSSIPTSLQPILEIETGGMGGIEKWLFYFEPNECQYDQGFFYTFLGKIMCENIPQNCKVSLVVSSYELYEKLIALPAPNLNMTFSIICVNCETQIVDDEYLLCITPGTTLKQSNSISIAESTCFPNHFFPLEES